VSLFAGGRCSPLRGEDASPTPPSQNLSLRSVPLGTEAWRKGLRSSDRPLIIRNVCSPRFCALAPQGQGQGPGQGPASGGTARVQPTSVLRSKTSAQLWLCQSGAIKSKGSPKRAKGPFGEVGSAHTRQGRCPCTLQGAEGPLTPAKPSVLPLKGGDAPTAQVVQFQRWKRGDDP